jgi:hypothetical protein
MDGWMDGWMVRQKEVGLVMVAQRDQVSRPDSKQHKLFRQEKINRGNRQGSKCQTGQGNQQLLDTSIHGTLSLFIATPALTRPNMLFLKVLSLPSISMS